MKHLKKLFVRIKKNINLTQIISLIIPLCFFVIVIVNGQWVKYIRLPGVEIGFYDKSEQVGETTTQNPDCQIKFITASPSVDTPERLCISCSFACHSGYCKQNARNSL